MNNSALIMDDYKPEDTNHLSLIPQEGQESHELEDVVNFVENKVINADGLTLAEVFQVLVQMLNGDLELIKKVLAHANIMVKYGMKVAQESQLTRSVVRRALKGKKGTLQHDFITSPPPILPNVKSTTKKGRGA